MQKSMTSDKVFVFVCYQAGSGGENLSTKISKLAGCKQLESYKTTEDRTIITNEYFDKVFLRALWDFDEVLNVAEQILKDKPLDDKLEIIPSHWDYPNLVSHFPNSKFIRIVHNGGPEVPDNIIKKIHGRKFETFQEFIGFCYGYVDDNVLKNLLREKQISIKMNAGEVYDILKPFMKNIPEPATVGIYTKLIEEDAVLNVWYKTFDDSMDKIFNFITQGEKV